MHIIHVIANNSSVPYFNWFAERVGQYTDTTFSFVAMYPERPAMIDDMEERGSKCYWIQFDHKKRKKSMVTSFFSLYRLFRRLKPDGIHTHLFDDSLPALLAARLAGVKLRVLHKEDTGFHWYYKPQWVWADRFNNANATHIIAVSGESKKFIIEKERAKKSKVYLIHHGIPIAEAIRQSNTCKAQLKKEYGLEGKQVITVVSRFIEWKGYRYVIEAAHTLHKKYKDIVFLCIGQGPQKEAMKQLVEKYDLTEYVVFVAGRIATEVMPSVYGVTDIYLHAAFMEPFGFVIAESMANGVPLVTTKTGAAGDALIHKETCYFTESKSAESIAAGIEWLLEYPAERNAMKEKLKRIAAEKFNVNRMMGDLIKLYKGQLAQ